jgi:hypothetical protein
MERYNGECRKGQSASGSKTLALLLLEDMLNETSPGGAKPSDSGLALTWFAAFQSFPCKLVVITSININAVTNETNKRLARLKLCMLHLINQLADDCVTMLLAFPSFAVIV